MNRITVAIATYNRAVEVEKTLTSLLRLDTTGCQDHEILLIDNKSTDNTPDVVARIAPLFDGRLRYVREEKQGLSHARNRAIDEARYEIVAYLDDDVDVDPAWLKGLLDAYSSGDIAAVGGRAHLVFPVAKPDWLAEPFVGLLTRVELGAQRRPAGSGELFGVNLSFRRDWLLKVGGFRTDLGRIGTALFGCEDDELLDRVARSGGKILYEPGAVVGHRVPLNRVSRKWFWKRSLWGAVTVPRFWRNAQVSGYELFRAGWHVGLACWQTVRAGLRTGPRSADCFQQLLTVAHRAGVFIGLVGELRQRGGMWGRPSPSAMDQPSGDSQADAEAQTSRNHNLSEA